jgi:hypothetical protein
MQSARFRELRITLELKEPYRWSSTDAVRMWVQRHHVPAYRRGRISLADTPDVDAAMREQANKYGDAS